ncbi:hypothetical protein COS55_02725 [Candidatus Shapirobacteria bacterium CG03_land_8_20_14_0_80_40_19]|uniref:Uncharacterized protein n=4 Tax=Candidatus Shapironibacteriota TaxID=1752721 RepID=A0A2M7BCR9_9BACT|nr:MAG: hypothetical protein COV89_01320 [Candidatus Shapirobacteria bacterium CG11_big_fil_rev_8_21_14_0_20_40_12]PIV00905.1 MAG: hypothetical protein COS55_02725 [Candidatus Shapirobacteria bacterium CG03_land_8_20_14_0_80_40_19]PJC29025.1 MAG: hypothetical protein CO053_01470 [Candidatus Shapirobacteria bacterium CG_4_9_14_0_2_um_filter_40_11]PJC76863.1 MAG: hypothetical protein CO010_01520 [Candidatus Shapirobacteria bacterium CG_4_8_14_3_um_filter_39_11]
MEDDVINTNVSLVEPVKKKKLPLYVFLAVLVVGLGVFTGSKIPKFFNKKETIETGKSGLIPKDEIKKDAEFGVKDPGQADTAIGVVEKGGIDGEGTHKLLREGGPSQNIYMTSSFLDLDSFAGMKIQIWGETMKAQKAGWLMDVLKIKVLE